MSLMQIYTPHNLLKDGAWPGATLLILTLALISIGVVMVASASIDYSGDVFGDPWFFTKRHFVFLAIALTLSAMVYSIPSILWHRFSIVLLLFGLLLLSVVLLPGVGRSVNGAQRWISLGVFSIQASEVVKFCFVVFFASFLARRTEAFQTGWSDFFKLIGILGVFVLLLLLEPDFGSSVVLCITGAAMMYLAGMPIIRFLLLALVGFCGLALLAVASPYRWQRLVTFLDPWAEQFSGGYQLVQSLIAFGRGEGLGMGLGNSLQKLFFLPEAHTDFIFAIIAEEFGLLGALAIITLFIGLIVQIAKVSLSAQREGNGFIAYACAGFAILFAIQAFINMGVASGLLPTKGLTLPFVSAGGSSLIVSCAMVALILRMKKDLRHD